MKKLLAYALAATTALSGFDLEVSGKASAFSLSRKVTEVRNDGVQAKDDTTLHTPNSSLFPSFGGNATLNYEIIENVYLGLTSGVSFDRAFGEHTSKKNEDAENTKTTADTDFGSSYVFIPVMLNAKWDILQFMNNTLNLFASAKGGVLFGMNMNEKTLVEDKTSTNLLNYGFGANFGAELYGFQLSLGYAGTLAGMTATQEAESKKVDALGYSNHAIELSLGYRLKDLF